MTMTMKIIHSKANIHKILGGKRNRSTDTDTCHEQKNFVFSAPKIEINI